MKPFAQLLRYVRVNFRGAGPPSAQSVSDRYFSAV